MSSTPKPGHEPPASSATGAPKGHGDEASDSPPGIRGKLVKIVTPILARLPAKLRTLLRIGDHGEPSEKTDGAHESQEKKPAAHAPAAPAVLPPLLASKPSLNASIARGIQEIGRALWAPDSVTRRMAALFFASLAGILLVTGLFANRFLVRSRLERAEASRIEAEQREAAQVLERDAEQAKDSLRWADLGRFTAEVRPDPDHPVSSAKNLVDINIGVRCADRETREFLDARVTQVRGEIAAALIGLRGEDLLSAFGKRRLKETLLKRLNNWVHDEFPKGKIEEVFISDLAVR
jgi:flagellar basal body-associated protein FliL